VNLRLDHYRNFRPPSDKSMKHLGPPPICPEWGCCAEETVPESGRTGFGFNPAEAPFERISDAETIVYLIPGRATARGRSLVLHGRGG